jgi:hypothetical protein
VVTYRGIVSISDDAAVVAAGGLIPGYPVFVENGTGLLIQEGGGKTITSDDFYLAIATGAYEVYVNLQDEWTVVTDLALAPITASVEKIIDNRGWGGTLQWVEVTRLTNTGTVSVAIYGVDAVGARGSSPLWTAETASLSVSTTSWKFGQYNMTGYPRYAVVVTLVTGTLTGTIDMWRDCQRPEAVSGVGT